MAIFDIIILTCLAVSLVAGIFKGFVKQAFSLAGLFIGIWTATRCTPQAVQWMLTWIDLDPSVLKVIGFIAIFALTVAVLSLLGALIDKVLRVALLGWLNRLLGACLAVCECLFFLCMALLLFDALNMTFMFTPQEKLDSSICYTPLRSIAYSVFPYLKELFFWN